VLWRLKISVSFRKDKSLLAFSFFSPTFWTAGHGDTLYSLSSPSILQGLCFLTGGTWEDSPMFFIGVSLRIPCFDRPISIEQDLSFPFSLDRSIRFLEFVILNYCFKHISS